MGRKIGIFGCSADPFTEAHAAIVKEVLAQQLVEHVFIAPTIVDYHREGKDKWLSAREKLNVIEAFIGNYFEKIHPSEDGFYDENITVWDKDLLFKEKFGEECSLVKDHRFLHTLLEIKSHLRRDDEVFTIIGSDSLKNFKTWWRYEEILAHTKLIVVNGRGGVKVESDIPHIDIKIPSEFEDISASKIREEYRELGCEAYINDLREKFANGIETSLARTPIFDLVRLPYQEEAGFCPIAVRSKDWVTVVVEHEGKFLREKQFRFGIMKESHEFPCGLVEEDESPAMAARRELEEETGICVEIDDLKYLGSFAANPAFMTNYMHYFYVSLDKVSWKQGKTHFDEHEKLECYWESKDQTIRKSISNPDTSSLMAGCICLLEKEGIV